MALSPWSYKGKIEYKAQNHKIKLNNVLSVKYSFSVAAKVHPMEEPYYIVSVIHRTTVSDLPLWLLITTCFR